ncbi:bifunctional 2-polyprenyl-6-hydroxyphenol methylase/3-demethylubiquinol 3-O-methyltransferase UbiG [Gilvimarinus sp. DA14]|uniref:bifunctional 2-polyprenyl-6-hydroxyphenol methylase/3-demethylubiquinol 3-O-methyltransferase UbiG n=1 Tax=Gilvimarinus sp. DA14 TaxID=2956798 RepID=UPI0020B80181|nr:bifunctional 2-polyprenyl-6-hydroxyphenol methylase/3-demethylubiquinol 3-O-methyltransferase UbiG [Gilvimarinus sp. DA14]UTF60764.1 bifunctional 2-polyprenyl-6-hydroxyphenol methylase/3-demethylubiquinol 3-O-methyltransferase UbiG [Gilvimarinus sp. DA14]
MTLSEQAQAGNADAEEIAKFEQLAERWWDTDGEFRPLHEMNPVRVNYIDERAPLAGKTVLDVGCGGGILSEAMAQRGAQVTGIDLGKAPLEVAENHAKQGELNIDYQLISAEEMAAAHPGHFDIVTCLEMLEHVPDPASIVTACAQLVKPGGHVFFSTLNRNPKAWGLAVVGAEYLLKLLPKGTHDYAKFIKPSELAAFARGADLSLVDTCGISYNPIGRHFKLAPSDVSVNYLMHTQKNN